MAAARADLIVDHVIEHAQWREQLVVLLAAFDVFLVGVHCAPD
jgi:chloramphenicol 3-O phosphotransferase